MAASVETPPTIIALEKVIISEKPPVGEEPAVTVVEEQLELLIIKDLALEGTDPASKPAEAIEPEAVSKDVEPVSSPDVCAPEAVTTETKEEEPASKPAKGVEPEAVSKDVEPVSSPDVCAPEASTAESKEEEPAVKTKEESPTPPAVVEEKPAESAKE